MKGYDYVVAQDGSGDFRTVQEALDEALRFWPRVRRLFRRAKVYVRPGVYGGFEVNTAAVEMHWAIEEGEFQFEHCSFINSRAKGDTVTISN